MSLSETQKQSIGWNMGSTPANRLKCRYWDREKAIALSQVCGYMVDKDCHYCHFCRYQYEGIS